MRRYLANSRQRVGGLTCIRCKGRFSGRDAYDLHLVQYADEDWCHLPEEVGLRLKSGGWWVLPPTRPKLDPAIARGGGIPHLPTAFRAPKRPARAV